MNTRATILLVAALALLPMTSQAQISTTTSKISWDIIGLDSNKPTDPSGPNTFMIGARLCNSGSSSEALTSVTAHFEWLDDAGNVDPNVDPYINLANTEQDTIPLLEPIYPGRCRDFYFNGAVTRTGDVWNSPANRSRQYRISWTASDEPGGTSYPVSIIPRTGWLYAERLVGQNRNSVAAIAGPGNLQVGGIYTFRVDWATATGGYEQIQHFVNLSNTSFLLLDSHSTYTAPPNGTSDSIYFDACGWIYDPTTPPDAAGTCSGTGKAGGNVDTWFTVQILSPAANAVLTSLIYDYSGSSFHYNDDFGDTGTFLTVNAQPAADLVTTLTADASYYLPGDPVVYTGSVCNQGPSSIDPNDPNYLGSATFQVLVPAGTLFQSFTAPPGFTCSGQPAVNAPGPAAITCTRSTTAFTVSECAPFTLNVTVNPAAPPGVTIINNVSASSTILDPDPLNNATIEQIEITRADWADLRVDLVSPAAVAQGGSFNLTATVGNNGPAAATSVSFSVNVPTGFTVGTLPTYLGWSCSYTAPAITCTATSLAANTDQIFSFPMTASGSAGTSGTFTGSVQTATGESTYANNVDATSTNIVNAGDADLALSITDTPDPVAAGETVKYTQTITNNGVVGAVNPYLTGTIPSGTIYTFINPPAGWTCFAGNGGSPELFNQPLEPGTAGPRNYRCTYAGTLAPGATVTIPLWLQTATTPTSGTINYTATVDSSTPDSYTANDSDTEDTTIGAETQADVEIEKLASSTVAYTGEYLAYTLLVRNNGPAQATNVAVFDDLPNDFNLVSATPTLGTCTPTSSPLPATNVNVNCAIGTLNVGGVATITILVQPNTADPSVVNTATVSATQSDPKPLNNTDSVSVSVSDYGPTAARGLVATAEETADGVRVSWTTGFEVSHLGFNVYRGAGGARDLLNATPVLGSAFIAGESMRLSAGFAYSWTDVQPVAGAVYFIESMGLDGSSETIGPIVPAGTPSAKSLPSAATNSLTFGEIGRRVSTPERYGSPTLHAEVVSEASVSADVLRDRQFAIAAADAVKILVSANGLYRVSKADLLAAGFDAGTNPNALQLFVNAEEMPIAVIDGGDRSFDAGDYLEFYAVGLDTMHSGTRTYWLVVSPGSNGKRFLPKTKIKAPAASAQHFDFTLARKDRVLYFASLTSVGREHGFFGPLVYWVPANQAFTVSNLAATGQRAKVDVALQGAVAGSSHVVRVTVNGRLAGTMHFDGLDATQASFDIPTSWLVEGTNTVTFTATNGSSDISLIDSVKLTYPHRFAADAGRLTFPTEGRTATTVTGFASPDVRVLDVTNPFWPIEVDATTKQAGATWELSVTTHEKGARVVLASSTSQRPASISRNVPSDLASQKNSADLLVITHPLFDRAIQPLADRRRAEGLETVVVSVEDVFDEFGFGSKDPSAIRDFLALTTTRWRKAPSYVLLVGDASFDSRNYMGSGYLDLVPTRTVQTEFLMSVSDDWFVDFDSDGLPNMFLGRLPVSTVAGAEAVVAKILAYDPATEKRALFVSDIDDGFSFELASRSAAANLPSGYSTKQLKIAGTTDPRGAFIREVNANPSVIDYVGHASVNVIGKKQFFRSSDVPLLSNRPALFVLMDCFNGLFHGTQLSLAEALLASPRAGAVAVWGSSAMTYPWPQSSMHRAFYQVLAQRPGVTIGEAVALAKAATTDQDVRASWILFGDPTMKLGN